MNKKTDLDPGQYAGRSQTVAANVARASELISVAAQELRLADRPEKVPLKDLERVKKTATAYVDECAASGVLPTVRGVAARLGVSRRAIYDYAAHHKGSEFDGWLQDFSDLCAELIMNLANEGVIAAVPAIFVTKARYGWRDQPVQIEVVQNNPLGPTVDPEDIATKYAELPDE